MEGYSDWRPIQIVNILNRVLPLDGTNDTPAMKDIREAFRIAWEMAQEFELEGEV